MNESEVREIIEVSLMEYANTLDYKKALEHGIERFINLTKQRTITDLPINTTFRESKEHAPTSDRIIERLTDEYNFDNEEKIGEL